jgi:uncharacterized oligopeptide transporter (OPT) family protein
MLYSRLLGDGSLPPHCGTFMLIFGSVFGLVSALRTDASGRGMWWAKWIPSGVAFAIGFLNTPAFSLARLIGGGVEYIYHKRSQSGDIKLIIIASGFVLGEGVISVISLILKTFDVPVVSCVGCEPGLCTGCP